LAAQLNLFSIFFLYCLSTKGPRKPLWNRGPVKRQVFVFGEDANRLTPTFNLPNPNCSLCSCLQNFFYKPYVRWASPQ
jgi:hypothetical protein